MFNGQSFYSKTWRGHKGGGIYHVMIRDINKKLIVKEVSGAKYY